jgi:type I restriction enzyme S subunit
MGFNVYDICEINRESLSKSDRWEYINYLDTSNLNNGIISKLEHLVIGRDKIPSRARRKVKRNDILISTVRPIQKHYGIIKKPIDNMIVSTGFAVLTPNTRIVDAEYLYRFLTQESITQYLQAVAETSTSAYPSIKPNVIGEIKVELPPLEEQETIANILSTLDEKIEVNNRINKALEEIAQAIFKHWFVDFEFPNEKGEPYKSSGGEMVESELGMIPKGWEVKPIEEILDFTISGEWGKENKDIKHTQKIFCIRGADFPDLENGNRADVPIRFIKEGSFKKRKLEDGDIILEISGGTKGRPTGRTIYIHEDMIMNYSNRLSFSNFCRLMRTNYALDSKILYYYLQFLYNSGVMETYQVQSTGISNFQFNYFIANELIIVPNKKIQKAFADIVESFLNKRNTYENHRLGQIRNTLLPKLMSGEIRVPIKSGGEVS